ncbi:lipopolysaccharide biosynthesis protein [Thermus scotoductus]|uniref:Lipopolysaccharide biosynthesis protein n=1 Tax=Thermus scotoductus TaxID=37636 RepID=A0A430RFS2_THESC|nr:Wzz/FepE/Etk N-terminal domain-containing protein [Thermus scotoductus]RTH06677.1 lipopolysaccharide biosynthesis protein [Thermus scotoductus]
MVETPQDELSLRDIVEVLKRHRVYLWALPLILATVALIYGFLIAEPTYASTATLSVAPVQVQAQLEQRIQVQQATPITFEGLKALALSEETVGEVWEALGKEGKLPTRWQDRGGLRGIERMMRDLKVKDISPKLQAVNPNQVPPIVASLTVQAPDPQVAAKAANLWVEAVKRRVNAIPLARLEASLKALEEQVTPAEKAYREAQARWEAFNKTTTLPQDKAELDAKTQERVGLDTELAGLERDLAAVQGRIQATLAEMRRQEAIVPIGTPPEQLAIINRRLAEAQASLARELERVRQSYTQAAQVLEKFKGREQIPVWQAELSAYTDAYASAQARLIALQKDLAQKQALLQDAEARLAEYKAQLPNLSIENLVAGLTVKEAEALVADRLKEADSRLKAAEGAWAEFQRKSQLEVWKRQLGGYADRVASIRQRLESLATERAIKQTRLEEAEKELAKEPRLITLEREITADPAVAAAIAQGGNLRDLLGLKLKNQELNPTHLKLLSTALDLRADLAALDREEKALKEEEAKLAPLVQDLQRRIADEEALRARLLTDLDTARDMYNAVYRYAESLKKVASRPDVVLREVSPDVLAYRDRIVDLEARLVALKAEEEALKEEERKLAPLVQDLQRRIADEEALRARLLTDLDTARDIYNAVYRYAESLKKVATRPDVVLREVSPDVLAYRDRVVGLRAEIAGLKAEEGALKRNLTELDGRIRDRKAKIAAQEREKEAVTLEYATKKAAYEAFRSRYDQIASLTARDLIFDHPNPEYQRLRGVLIDAQAEEARLLARKAALQARIAQVEARLGLLKDRVAKAQVEQDTVNQALDLAKNAYLALTQKRTDLQIQIASNQEAWASVLAPAYPVYEKVAPKRGLLLALALALGLMLGVMAAFVAEALRPPRAEAAG